MPLRQKSGKKIVVALTFLCCIVLLLQLFYLPHLRSSAKNENHATKTMAERRHRITKMPLVSGMVKTAATPTGSADRRGFQSEPTFEQEETKLILLYTKFFNGPWYLRWNDNFPCHVQRCNFTYNKSAMYKAHAILFHDADIPSKMPQRRRSDQLWVYFNLETPLNSKATGDIYNGVFNWTMSYRVDADVYTPYGNFRPVQCHEKTTFNEKTSHAAGKTKLIAWVVSACETPSGRLEYARKLAEYVSVDIFGKCGNFSCPKPANDFHLSEECKVKLSRYKFYLAFENSLCEDYITEKYWEHGLENGLVPIVLGGANYRNLAIPGSYVDVQKFKTVAQVAEYIKYLDNNDTAYNEFFKWKKLYKLETSYMNGCVLCAALNNKITRKVYENFDEYWSKDKCYGRIQIS